MLAVRKYNSLSPNPICLWLLIGPYPFPRNATPSSFRPGTEQVDEEI